MKKVRLSYQWGLRFFGLTPNDQGYLLEQAFTLMYYMGFTYQDTRNIPVWKRSWFVNRLIKEFENARENNSQQYSKASHMNTPEQKMFRGSFRESSPSRLNRPT